MPLKKNPLGTTGGVAVVTGAGSGIGKATAGALARRGAFVVAVDIDETAAKATALALDGASYGCDVSDLSAMAKLAATIRDEHGVPEILVNNAGVGMTGRFLDTTEEDWEWILGINLRGVIHGCQLFGPSMLEAGRGHVVNLSSGLGFTPRATEPAYCTTKAAVLALSQCLRSDWGPSGIGVSAICPGIIRTPIVDATRYLGERSTARTRDGVQRLFAKGHAPTLVARAIVGAIEKNSPVVPVGIESQIGWILHRLLPTRLVDRLARTGLDGV